MSDRFGISDAFLKARRSAVALDSYPGVVPSDLASAYAVQARSITDWGEPVAGFKVGGIGPQWRDRYPSQWLAGPIFPSVVHRVEQKGHIQIPVYAGGFAAYEAELLMRLEGVSELDDPIETIAAAKAFVKAVHIGAEIASSPLATLNELGPGSIISDFGNQAGVVIGPEIDLIWLDQLNQIDVTLRIDGIHIGQTFPSAGEAGPLGALRFLLNHLRTNPPPTGLADTLWLSSGAITGVHQSEPNTVGEFDYGSLGQFSVSMVRATDRDSSHPVPPVPVSPV